MRDDFIVIEELSIPSTFDYIPKIESLVEFICSKLNIEDSFGNVLIAVTEAINNAIIHGNKNDGSLFISVKLSEGEKMFYFSIEDQGNGFDYKKKQDPTLIGDIFSEFGRGLFLIQNLSDSVEFENEGRRINIFFNKKES